jgi:hypothetical protein
MLKRLCVGAFASIALLSFQVVAFAASDSSAGSASKSGVEIGSAKTLSSEGASAVVTRISPKRTVIIVDFSRGASIAVGAKVNVKAAGDEIRGTVKKINPKGRAIIRLTKALSESVELGSIELAVVDRGPEDKQVQIVGSGVTGFWTGAGYLEGYDAQGVSGKVDANLEFASGSTKVSGGPAAEKVNFGVGNTAYGVTGGARYLRGSFGGGLNVGYKSSASESKSSIETAATQTKDSDSIIENSSGFEMLPHGVFVNQDRGFSVGLGWRYSSGKTERKVKIDDVESPNSPVNITENSLVLEGKVPLAAMKLGLIVELAGQGKIKEKDLADVKRNRSGLRLNLWAAVGGMDQRVGFGYEVVKDKYSSSELARSLTTLDWESMINLYSMNLVPRIAYERTGVSFGSQEGTENALLVGSKITFGQPFVGASFVYRDRDQASSSRSPSYKTSLMGLALAGGTTF